MFINAVYFPSNMVQVGNPGKVYQQPVGIVRSISHANKIIWVGDPDYNDDQVRTIVNDAASLTELVDQSALYQRMTDVVNEDG